MTGGVEIGRRRPDGTTHIQSFISKSYPPISVPFRDIGVWSARDYHFPLMRSSGRKFFAALLGLNGAMRPG